MPDEYQNLREIMRRLRDPQRGCPWDLQQDFASIAPYTLEEAYEVDDAIARGDMQDLCEELGDLLLQVVFHAQMAEELDLFDLQDVEAGICAKMLRRHPHVFGHAVGLAVGNEAQQAAIADAVGQDAAAQTESWEAIKAAEKQARKADASGEPDDSRLADIPLNLPALTRARKLGKKAARAGFDWPDIAGVWDKLDEETTELKAELDSDSVNDAAVEHEYGDMLFALVNLGRHLQLDPEQALRRANRRFETRFRLLETQLLAHGKDVEAADLNELEAAWQAAKQALSNNLS